MAPFKLLLAPIRRVINFPLVQLALAVAAILWLQAANDASILGQTYNAIDRLVDFTVQRFAAIFEIGRLSAFTAEPVRSWVMKET